MEEMTEQEMQALVAQTMFGHLGLARGDSAYVVPLFYGVVEGTFYFHTHRGVKTEFIESTEEACFVVTQVQSVDDWASVEAFGRLEEVTDERERLAAADALMSAPLPPEWGITETGEPRHSDREMQIYRLRPQRMTGRKSARPAPAMEDEIATGGM